MRAKPDPEILRNREEPLDFLALDPRFGDDQPLRAAAFAIHPRDDRRDIADIAQDLNTVNVATDAPALFVDQSDRACHAD